VAAGRRQIIATLHLEADISLDRSPANRGSGAITNGSVEGNTVSSRSRCTRDPMKAGDWVSTARCTTSTMDGYGQHTARDAVVQREQITMKRLFFMLLFHSLRLRSRKTRFSIRDATILTISHQERSSTAPCSSADEDRGRRPER